MSTNGLIDAAGLEKLTGVPRETVRSWEHRNGAGRPLGFPEPLDRKLAGGTFYRAADVTRYLDSLKAFSVS